MRSTHEPSPVFWLYGRSGAGKTTLSAMACQSLRELGWSVFRIDGDVVRSGLSSDLGFDEASRTENHRRMAEVARMASDQGQVVVGSSMVPGVEQRVVLRRVLGDRLRWVHLDASWEVCEARDAKALYRKASRGELPVPIRGRFDLPCPGEVDLLLETGTEPIGESHRRLVEYCLRCLQEIRREG
jgi:adenylylsulfate kinase